MPKILEKDIQRTIIDYLRVKGIFCYKHNNAGIYKKSTGQYIPSGVLGVPDIICVIKGQYIGIEVKGEKGKQTPDQFAFQQLLEANGGRYILARSVQDIINLGI